jgi:hypothetical protein
MPSNTVSLFKVGGRHWDGGKRDRIRSLLALQDRNGLWPAQGNEAQAGPIYATSLAVLALAVEYQYLPIYQR